MNRFPPEGAEQFVIGSIAALCPACRCEWFLPKKPDGPASEVYTCVKCGVPSSRAALVGQISEESVRQSQEIRQRSRAGSGKPPEEKA